MEGVGLQRPDWLMSSRILIAFSAALFASCALSGSALARSGGNDGTQVTIDQNGATANAHSSSSGNAQQAGTGGGSWCPAPTDPEFYFACGNAPQVCPGGVAVMSPPGS